MLDISQIGDQHQSFQIKVDGVIIEARFHSGGDSRFSCIAQLNEKGERVRVHYIPKGFPLYLKGTVIRTGGHTYERV